MANNLPALHRVVTGHNESGTANIVWNSLLDFTDIPGMAGARSAPIWTTVDSIPTDDNNSSEDGAMRPVDSGIVHSNGTNLRATDLAPGAVTPMHRTVSLDHNILIQGEVILVMEDGSETHLKTPGDVVVMKGGLHAWRNPSTDSWARWVSVIIAAQPAIVLGKALEAEVK
ncbi:Cupin-2 domain-containing protein [Mycena kentingensis (nom. inval.)]|nr:Cupin-2 domain-containing protein [Mycena kentingensis (nom. inval.)]